MYRIAAVALVLSVTGCATTGGGGSLEGNATVAGVVRLPEKCEGGATPTVTPAPSAVKVGNYATVNRDFALSCGA